MSREDYEMLKRIREWQEFRKENASAMSTENDELIIEQNTIYEVDFDCYDCMMKDKMKYFNNNRE